MLVRRLIVIISLANGLPLLILPARGCFSAWWSYFTRCCVRVVPSVALMKIRNLMIADFLGICSILQFFTHDPPQNFLEGLLLLHDIVDLLQKSNVGQACSLAIL